MRKSDKKPHALANVKGAVVFTHLGATLAGSVLGLFFLGYWIDGMIGSRPWLAIAGAFIGATGGFINLVLTLKQIQEEGEREKARGDDAAGRSSVADRGDNGDRSDRETGDQ